jgi:hypothetical protein
MLAGYCPYAMRRIDISFKLSEFDET